MTSAVVILDGDDDYIIVDYSNIESIIVTSKYIKLSTEGAAFKYKAIYIRDEYGHIMSIEDALEYIDTLKSVGNDMEEVGEPFPAVHDSSQLMDCIEEVESWPQHECGPNS